MRTSREFHIDYTHHASINASDTKLVTPFMAVYVIVSTTQDLHKNTSAIVNVNLSQAYVDNSDHNFF